MMLQKELTNIEQYNAAIELPSAGLVGIGAYTAKPRRRDVSLAVEELGACVKLCRMAESALSGQAERARKNVYFYSAWQRIISSEEERDAFRRRIAKTRESIVRLLEFLKGGTEKPPPTKEQVDRLQQELMDLSERIKREIPRDTSLASLMGPTHPRIMRRS